MWSVEAVVLTWWAAGTGAVVLQTAHTLIRTVCTIRSPVAHQIWVHTLPTSTWEQVCWAFHLTTYKTSKCSYFYWTHSGMEFKIDFRHALTSRFITLVLAILHAVTPPRLHNALSFRCTWPLELTTLQRSYLAVLNRKRRACLIVWHRRKTCDCDKSSYSVQLAHLFETHLD